MDYEFQAGISGGDGKLQSSQQQPQQRTIIKSASITAEKRSNEDLSSKGGFFGQLKKSLSKSDIKSLSIGALDKSLTSSKQSLSRETNLKQQESISKRSKSSLSAVDRGSVEDDSPTSPVERGAFANWPVLGRLSRGDMISDEKSSNFPTTQPMLVGLEALSLGANPEPNVKPSVKPTTVPKLNLGGLFNKPMKKKPVEIQVDVADEDAVPELPTMPSRFKPIDSKALCDWLLDDSMSSAVVDEETIVRQVSNLLIMDVRTFVAFNASHILGSHNVNLPNLVLKRFRRGSVQFFNMESFLCGEEGKKAWREKTDKTRIVILDDTMPKSEREFQSQDFKSTLAGSLVASLEKEMAMSSWIASVYWLKNGYADFLEYCSTTQQSITKNNETISLSNMRWIDTLAEEVPALSVTIPAPTSPSSKSPKDVEDKWNSEADLRTTKSSTTSTKSGTTAAIKNFLGNLRTKSFGRLGLGPSLPQEPPVSPTFKDPNIVDCSQILPWLLLGADPAVVTNTTNGLTRSVSRAELYVDLPSPTTPTSLKPPSPTVQVDKASTIRLNLAATAEQLKRMNVSYIVNVANECVDLSQYIMRRQDIIQLQGYRKVGMYDNTEEDVEKVAMECLQIIEEFHKADPDGIIYVHCRAGRSRSATIAIAYLMKTNRWSLQEAYEHVKLRRPAICPNLGFMCVLRKWEREWGLGIE